MDGIRVLLLKYIEESIKLELSKQKIDISEIISTPKFENEKISKSAKDLKDKMKNKSFFEKKQTPTYESDASKAIFKFVDERSFINLHHDAYSYDYLTKSFKSLYKENISLFHKRGYIDVLNNVDDSEYVICICYHKCKAKDWQIGITETCKKNKHSNKDEDFFDTVKMGMSQEIGITIDDDKYQSADYIQKDIIRKTKKGSIKRRTGIYLIDVKNTRPISMIESKITYSKKDDRTQKVACLIHGNLEDMLNVITNITYRQSEVDSDNLIGLFKVGFIKNILDLRYSIDDVSEYNIIKYDYDKDENLFFDCL